MRPMAEVRCGVIGLGFIGGRWARALAEHAGARLAVVCDVRVEVARQAAERYGAAVVSDPLEAAAHRDLDAVAVCTPEHAHTAAALTAVDAAKAVMVEKPLAHTVADAEEIRDRAAARGVPVLAGHTLRFDPRYAAVREAIESGAVGAVQAVRSERIGLVSDQQVLGGRTSIALYYGVHEFDLCRWYAGEVEAIWATCSSGILAADGYAIEDLYSVGLRFASGAHGTAMVGWCLPAATPGYGVAGFTVIGERGLLRVNQGDAGLLAVGSDGPLDRDVYYSPEVNGRLYGSFAIEVDHFVGVARGEVEPRCTAADGAAAVRIALAMEEAAHRDLVVRP
jgi:myo-inositol 2-dehydrogenase/D-chiro-inositol 1-dehydrogenase